MSRWIDAEWLKELYKPYESYNGKELTVPIGVILANIDDAPSIDIVFCKECRYGQDDLFHMFCAYHHHKTYANDFCSYGERREP